MEKEQENSSESIDNEDGNDYLYYNENDHFDKQIFDILNIPLNKNNVTVAHEFIKNHPNDLDWDIIKIKQILDLNQHCIVDTSQIFGYKEATQKTLTQAWQDENKKFQKDKKIKEIQFMNQLLNEAFTLAFIQRKDFMHDIEQSAQVSQKDHLLIEELKEKLMIRQRKEINYSYDKTGESQLTLQQLNQRKNGAMIVKIKAYLKQLIADNLEVFLDNLIENNILKTNNDEDDILKQFSKNQILYRRGIAIQEQLMDQKEQIKALKKLASINEISQLSLKHKIRQMKMFHRKDLSDLQHKLEQEKLMEIQQIQIKLKMLFDKEIQHIQKEKYQLRKQIYEREILISKLTNIVYRQEIDTYDPNLEAPRDNIGYFQKIDSFFDKNGTFKCQKCLTIQKRNLEQSYEAHKIEQAIDKLLFDLDKPLSSSQIGTKEIFQMFNSEDVDFQKKISDQIEFKLQQEMKLKLQSQIFKSNINERLADNPQGIKLTYPFIPFSNEYVNELKENYQKRIDIFAARVKELNQSNNMLIDEKEIQIKELESISKIAEQNMELAIISQNEATEFKFLNIEIENKMKQEQESHQNQIIQIEESNKLLIENMNIERLNFSEDLIIETELKELIIKKKDIHIQRLKNQLFQLIKISRYPRLIKEMWDRFKEEKDNILLDFEKQRKVHSASPTDSRNFQLNQNLESKYDHSTKNAISSDDQIKIQKIETDNTSQNLFKKQVFTRNAASKQQIQQILQLSKSTSSINKEQNQNILKIENQSHNESLYQNDSNKVLQSAQIFEIELLNQKNNLKNQQKYSTQTDNNINNKQNVQKKKITSPQNFLSQTNNQFKKLSKINILNKKTLQSYTNAISLNSNFQEHPPSFDKSDKIQQLKNQINNNPKNKLVSQSRIINSQKLIDKDQDFQKIQNIQNLKQSLINQSNKESEAKQILSQNLNHEDECSVLKDESKYSQTLKNINKARPLTALNSRSRNVQFQRSSINVRSSNNQTVSIQKIINKKIVKNKLNFSPQYFRAQSKIFRQLQRKVIPKDMIQSANNIQDMKSSQNNKRSNSSKDFKRYDSNEKQGGVLININLDTYQQQIDVQKDSKNDLLQKSTVTSDDDYQQPILTQGKYNQNNKGILSIQQQSMDNDGNKNVQINEHFYDDQSKDANIQIVKQNSENNFDHSMNIKGKKKGRQINRNDLENKKNQYIQRQKKLNWEDQFDEQFLKQKSMQQIPGIIGVNYFQTQKLQKEENSQSQKMLSVNNQKENVQNKQNVKERINLIIKDIIKPKQKNLKDLSKLSDLNSLDRMHELYAQTQFNDLDKPKIKDEEEIEMSDVSSEIIHPKKIQVLPMTVINIGQMLTTNNNFIGQRQSDGFQLQKKRQYTFNRPQTSQLREKSKIFLKNNLNNTFNQQQSFQNDHLKQYYDTYTNKNLQKQKNIDIVASSIRPQFEIDRFKNVKKSHSINSNRKLIISSTQTNSSLKQLNGSSFNQLGHFNQKQTPLFDRSIPFKNIQKIARDQSEKFFIKNQQNENQQNLLQNNNAIKIIKSQNQIK